MRGVCMLARVVQACVAGDQTSAGSTPREGVRPPMSDEPPTASTFPSGRSVRFRCERARAIDAVCRHAGDAAVVSITYVVARDGTAPPLSSGSARYELPAFMNWPGRYITPLPASSTFESRTDHF